MLWWMWWACISPLHYVTSILSLMTSLKKLVYYGVRGVVLSLIKSYLQNRFQCVNVNQEVSDFKPIMHSVPQGSVLWPLFFVIYNNDMWISLSCYICLVRRWYYLNMHGESIWRIITRINNYTTKCWNWICSKLTNWKGQNAKMDILNSPLYREHWKCKTAGDHHWWKTHREKISGIFE